MPATHIKHLTLRHIKKHTYARTYLILSTLKAKLPTKSVDPSGALHPFGDFPLYGKASMGILSPKGMRTIRSSVIVIAPSLYVRIHIHLHICAIVISGVEQ